MIELVSIAFLIRRQESTKIKKKEKRKENPSISSLAHNSRLSNFCLHLSSRLSITRALNLDATPWQSGEIDTKINGNYYFNPLLLSALWHSTTITLFPHRPSTIIEPVQNSLYTFSISLHDPYPRRETSFLVLDSFQFHHRLYTVSPLPTKFRSLRDPRSANPTQILFEASSPRIVGNTLATFDREQACFRLLVVVIGDNKCSTGRWRGEGGGGAVWTRAPRNLSGG